MTQNNRLGSVLALVCLLALAVAGMVKGLSLFPVKGAANGPPSPASSAPVSQPAMSADEKAIRATGEAFVRACNAADAKAVAALYAPDAEYTNEEGQSFSGRDEIEQLYAELFAANPGATLSITPESIRFLGPDIAVEKGVARVQSSTGSVRTAARYTVVHARRDGQWTMVVARDAPYSGDAGVEALKELGWLIGQWRPEAPGRGLELKAEWIAQNNFIKNTIFVTAEGDTKVGMAQIIGWDPRLAKIVSWNFDVQGGFGQCVWTRDGEKWVIEATGVFRNGSESTAVNIITPLDANSFTWQSTARTLDGVRLPEIPPVKIVRVKGEQSERP